MRCNEIITLATKYIEGRPDYKEIVFAALQGGFARQTANEESDIDIVLAYEKKKDIYCFERFIEYEDRLIELRFLVLSEVPPAEKWLERTRYIYTKETIFFYGNKSEWEKFSSKCRMSNDEKKDLFIFCLKRCARRGVFYKDNALMQNNEEQIKRTAGMKINMLGINRKDYWINKGDYISAKLLCASTLEYLIVMIFTLNDQFTPSPKYRYFLLQKLDWLPNSIHVLFKYIEEDSAWQYREMQSLFCDLLTECVCKAESEGMFIDEFDNYTFTTNLPISKEDAPF